MMALVTLGWYSGSVTEGIWAALGYPRGSPRNETLLIYFGAFLINCWSCNIVAYSSLEKLLNCFGDDPLCFNYSRLSNAKDLDNLDPKFNRHYGNTVWNLIKGTPGADNGTKQSNIYTCLPPFLSGQWWNTCWCTRCVVNKWYSFDCGGGWRPLPLYKGFIVKGYCLRICDCLCDWCLMLMSTMEDTIWCVLLLMLRVSFRWGRRRNKIMWERENELFRK